MLLVNDRTVLTHLLVKKVLTATEAVTLLTLWLLTLCFSYFHYLICRSESVFTVLKVLLVLLVFILACSLALVFLLWKIDLNVLLPIGWVEVLHLFLSLFLSCALLNR